MNLDTCHVWKRDSYLCEKGKNGFLINTEAKGRDRDRASWVGGWCVLRAKTTVPGPIQVPALRPGSSGSGHLRRQELLSPRRCQSW